MSASESLHRTHRPPCSDELIGKKKQVKTHITLNRNKQNVAYNNTQHPLEAPILFTLPLRNIYVSSLTMKLWVILCSTEPAVYLICGCRHNKESSYRTTMLLRAAAQGTHTGASPYSIESGGAAARQPTVEVGCSPSEFRFEASEMSLATLSSLKLAGSLPECMTLSALALESQWYRLRDIGE